MTARKTLPRKHPAEVTAAAVGTPLGAAFILLWWAGVDVPQVVQGAIIVLVGWIAGLVTKWKLSRGAA